MTDVVGWATKKTSDGLISGEINQNWLFCIPIQVGPATEYARGARHWFAFIILTQVGQAVAQLILSGALLTSVMMAVTALIGLYAWYQDMNITYICLWGAASLFQGLMTCISSLLPAITGVLSFDVWSLVLLISVPVVYFLAAAFAWHLYNDYAEDHGKKAYAFDPFGKYAAKYDPLAKVPISDSVLVTQLHLLKIKMRPVTVLSLHMLSFEIPGAMLMCLPSHGQLLFGLGEAIGDSEGEFGEVAALMRLSLKAYQATLQATKTDFQFEVSREGEGRDCLVMPPSNFALLGLKDTFHMLLKGYRVLLIVQPRFFPHFREIQLDLASCGLPDGLVEVLPGITPDADPEVLHEALRHVDRLQFTGSSDMFKSLVLKALELGNLRMEHAGEVSGLNKVRLDNVSVSHPAVARGTCWAAMARKQRRAVHICRVVSFLTVLQMETAKRREEESKAKERLAVQARFDASVGDNAEMVKAALDEAQKAFNIGRDPADTGLDILLRDGKTDQLEVKTQEPADGFREWWEKAILATPRDGPLQLRTNQSLGHCVYAPSISRAVELGTKEDASNIYCVGVPEDASAPSARAGTTGAKLPESAFGGMKSYTYAVAGDHDGVGTVQTLFDITKRRGPNYRDQEEAYAQYELTEVAEMLLEFLSPKDQMSFTKQISNVLEIFSAFQPELTAAYGGQGLVNAEGRSQLVTLQVLKPSRKQLLIPRGVGLPEDIVKMAALCAMSPLKEIPVDLHLLSAAQAGKLRVTDPLKSFLKVVDKNLGWRVHYHEDTDMFVSSLKSAEYPPYFFCIKDKHLLPLEVLKAVAEQGGYMYEDLPSDPFSLFRCLTATQAWTVACTEAQAAEAGEALMKAWQTAGLRQATCGPSRQS
ncbi:unnamed protein product [Symbiodinium sp. CCMP2456]|nr:unnamed protein product [Symbiodinium sp. CCMP2456]